MKIKSADGYHFTKISQHALDHSVPLQRIIDALESSRVGPGNSEGIAIVVHDFGFAVGLNNCVSVDHKVDIVEMVKRPGRNGPTPIVKGRNPQRTSILTIIVSVRNEVVITAYFGPPAPREPWDPTLTTLDERLDSSKFWAHHALIR